MTSVRGACRRLYAIARFACWFGVWACAHLLPRDRHRWAFSSLGGEAFHGNSKYLFLHVANEREDITPIWIGETDDVARLTDAGYRAVDRNSLRGQWTVLRAGVVLNSHGMDVPWWCTGGATVVQLWHGNGIKKLGWGSEEFARHSRFRSWFYRVIYWNWDYAIVPSGGDPAERLSEAFRMDEDAILVTGYPRTDVLVDPAAWGDLDDASITIGVARTTITYLPTYRQGYGNVHGDGSPIDQLDVDALDRCLEELDAHLLIKLHPREQLQVDLAAYDRITQLPQRQEVMPLLAATDLLITDYSSAYIDFLLLDRPIIFFAPDRETYLARQDLYFPYEEVTPGPIVEDQDALLAAIQDLLTGEDQWDEARARVRHRFHDHVDGQSSERVVAAVRSRVLDGEPLDSPARAELSVDGSPTRGEV